MSTRSKRILGISGYYHDSAAALVLDGAIVAAAQEERFSRKKFDASFPTKAVKYCLEAGGLELQDLTDVVFYDKPLLKFDRLLETYLAFAPQGLRSFMKAMPVWLKEKAGMKGKLLDQLAAIGGCKKGQLPPLHFTEHHQSHAASAFYPSPFERASVICLDGVGEWATTSVWSGERNTLIPRWQIDFPHSLGLLYSAVTYFAGFKVNSGEYKLMGLAPYGEPRYADLMLRELVDLKPDGTFRLNMKYFDYPTGLKMTSRGFETLFGGPAREPEAPLTQREMDLAASVQSITDEIILRLARTVYSELKVENLCLAGGVALNCVTNGRVLREGPFRDIWVQPAAGDSGGALGAALTIWYSYYDQPRRPSETDAMRGCFLGPSYNESEIQQFLDSIHAPYQRLSEGELSATVARLLASEHVVGWFQGKMEFGPRSLGARSILGDARSPRMQSEMNLKIKYRESFRPFAPAVTAETAADYFELDRPSPYMLFVAPVRKEIRTEITGEHRRLFGIEKLNVPRSTIPAVTHVDYSARIQTVHRETNRRFHELLAAFQSLTGCAVVVNTSFNVRGEPIVCTPQDAYRCFMRTEMDYLVIENLLLTKADQSRTKLDESWEREFELD